MNNKIDYDNLKYAIYSSKKIYNFSELKDPLTLLDEIKKGEMTLEEAKNYEKDYLSYLKNIRKGNKNVEQRQTLANLNMFYNAREEAIKCIEDYGSMILEVKKLEREQEGTGLKILTPNQMLKRLPIALAQVKAGNNSERLLGSTESKITKDINGENVPHLEVVELVLVHCNLVNNDYQQDSRILLTFVPNKSFRSSLEISPTNQVFLKTLNSEFQEVKVWFTDQTSKPLELKDKINITLIIK